MTSALSPIPSRLPSQLSPRARHYAEKSKAANTRRAYKSGFADFTFWCKCEGFVSLPALPETVTEYITWLADQGAALSTIQQRLAAIAFAHRVVNQDPTRDEGVRIVMEGIRRDYAAQGIKPHGKAAVLRDDLAEMLAHLPDGLRGTRDRAILLLGFAGAFRRSELAALTVADLAFRQNDMVVTIQRSKTDQAGAGSTKTIPTLKQRDLCAVRAVKAWLKESGISEGPLFRAIDRWGHVRAGPINAQLIRLIVRQYANLAGLKFDDFSAHSLRVGFVSQAAADGKHTEEIMSVTLHKSASMVERYNREKERLQVRTIRSTLGEKE